MAKSKDKLLVDVARASRLDQTIATKGWGDIKEIIQLKYDSLMNDLLEKESAEARGGINAITEIMNDITRELSFGETARKKYSERYLHNKETL